MKVFKDIAAKGKSTMGWYVGFKLHLLCNEKGELINFVLTRANVDDRILMNLLAAMGAYCFFATKPEVNFDFEVPESSGQLVLWD